YNDQGEITNPNSPHNFEGEIDMSIFSYSDDPEALEDDIENANTSNTDTAVRYSFYNPDNQVFTFKNNAIKNSIETNATYGFNSNGKLTALLGRFAEPNIYDLWTDPD